MKQDVIRVCEITGHLTTVGTNLTEEDAKALVTKLTAEDGDYAHYFRCTHRPY